VKTIGLAGWKADVGKHFFRRVTHLLDKPGVDHWIWGVRETNDLTFMILENLASGESERLTVVKEEWPPWPERILNLSVLGDWGIGLALQAGADRVLIHESDLITPTDVVDRLSATPGAVVGGWPVLANKDVPEELMLYPGAMLAEQGAFYDTWAYRQDGVRFLNREPYHPSYVADRPFRIDSVGSVALVDAEYLRRGARCFPGGFVGLCESVRRLGGEVWCDPTVPVVQPLELWKFNDD